MALNNRNCCVFGCTSRKGKNPSLSFHKFPSIGRTVYTENEYGITEKVSQRKVWINKLKMGKPITDNMRVCSLHFSKEDFIRPGDNKKKHSLVPAAVPSCKLPESSHEMSRPKRNPPKTRASSNFSKHMACATISKSNVEMDLPLDNPDFSNSESNERIQAAEALLDIQNLVVNKKFGVDCSTEVKSGDFIEPFSNRIVTAKDLSTLTGLQSFQLLYTIVELVAELFPKNRKKRTVMPLKDQVIFTFMKLKTGNRYNVLSILFQVNEVSCRIIFHETLIKVAKVLQYAIIWPSKEEVLNSMPLCFEGFEKTRVVLDCTEIPLQQAKCLCCRLKTYSQYKKRHTIKVLTGVSPAGLITYVSKAYGGRTSDKELFQQSPVLQLCDQFVDNIMVDKGFLIGDIAEAEGIKIIQPPFLRKQNQFSRQEALLNAKIARARVHIERTNQRMKVFEIFNKPFPLSLLPQVDNILTIICAIVNLSNPIFSEDKFL